MKKKYRVPVTWMMCGIIRVAAETPEEALKVAEAEAKTCFLPANGEYVDDSLQVDYDSEPLPE